VIIASHNLDELQRLADRVAIIDHGRLQRLVTTGYDKSAETASVYRLSVAHGAEKMTGIFPDAVDTGNGEFEIPVTSLGDLNARLSEAIAAGTVFASVVPSRSVLEQQFREAVGEKR
jgi:ABC-type multidrug transport system ATPase subunit